MSDSGRVFDVAVLEAERRRFGFRWRAHDWNRDRFLKTEAKDAPKTPGLGGNAGARDIAAALVSFLPEPGGPRTDHEGDVR